VLRSKVTARFPSIVPQPLSQSTLVRPRLGPSAETPDANCVKRFRGNAWSY
jgi:hypothetical protein